MSANDPSAEESVESVMSALAEWSADQRVGEAVDARIRERWLRQQAAESSTLAGVALDLAEAGASMALRTATGRVHHGRIESVGRDFLVVRTNSGRPTFVATASVLWLRPEPGAHSDGSGGRGAPLDVSLADVLLQLSGDRPRLQVTSGGETLTGELRSVGEDVLTLRLDADPPAPVHLRLGSIDEVSPL